MNENFIEENEQFTEESEQINEHRESETDDRWTKTHPLTPLQNRIIYAALAVVAVGLGIVFYFGLQEMFRSQGQ